MTHRKRNRENEKRKDKKKKKGGTSPRLDFICAIWLIHSCSKSVQKRPVKEIEYVKRDIFICKRDICICKRELWKRLIDVCDMCRLQHLFYLCVWRSVFRCVTCHIHMCDMTHSFTWYDWLYARHVWLYARHAFIDWLYARHAFIHVIRLTLCATCSTWLSHLCDMTYAHMQPYVFVILASFICATRLIHSNNTTYSMRNMFDMTHLFMWHDVFTCATICTGDTACFVRVTWRIHSCNTTSSMRDMTHPFMRNNLFICATICMGDTWISHATWMNESCRTCRA